MFKWKTSSGSTIRILKVGITNCYLIESNNSTILVDSGPKRFSKKAFSLLNSNLKDNKQLNYLLLTHTHYDHSQNAKSICGIYHPKLIVHKSESKFLKTGFTRIPNGTLWLTKIISNLGNKFAPQIAEYDAVNPDIIVDSEYLIETNSGLKIIETPGHTDGSVSLIIDNEIAIVGDTLFAIFKSTIYPPFANNESELIKTWEKLLQTPCRIFLPAHGKAIKRNILEKEFLKYKR